MIYILNDQLFDFLQNFCPNVEIDHTETGIEISDPSNPDSVYRIADKDDSFGVVRWCDADIAESLASEDFLVTEETVGKVRSACENDHHFTDRMISAGWDAITHKIYELEDRNWE